MKISKKKLWIWSIVLILFFLLLGGLALKTDTGNKFAFWITNKLVSHRVAGTETPQFTMGAEELIKAFTNNQQTTQYADKSILISGTITLLEDKNVILNQSLVCNIDSTQLEKIKTLKVNETVQIQGRCIGYNDLMGEVTLDGCYIK